MKTYTGWLFQLTFCALLMLSKAYGENQTTVRELSLKEAIQLAVEHHPRTRADRLATLAQEKEIGIARSRYLPNLSAMALVTNGFPGSAGASGITGLMVSPFHKGPTAGLFLEQNIYDFGRTALNIEIAERSSTLSEAQYQISSLGIALSLVRTYYHCVEDKILMRDYALLEAETRNIEKEVVQFVNKGQRSIIDKYLSKSQTEATITLKENYEKRYELDQKELALITGISRLNPVDCGMLSDELFQEMTLTFSHPEQNPYFLRAKNFNSLAKSELERAKKDYLPFLIGIGSLGMMSSTDLGIPKQNYSLALGLTWPLFQGFATKRTVERNKIRLDQAEAEQAGVEQDLEQENIRFDREIASAKLRMNDITIENDLAKKAVTLAKKRYQSLQGDLVDLREAIRNLARTSTELRNAQVQFLSQSAQKALFNNQFEFKYSYP